MNDEPLMSGGQSQQQISTLSSFYLSIIPSQLAPVTNMLANEEWMKRLSTTSSYITMSPSTISSLAVQQKTIENLEVIIQNKLSTLSTIGASRLQRLSTYLFMFSVSTIIIGCFRRAF